MQGRECEFEDVSRAGREQGCVSGCQGGQGFAEEREVPVPDAAPVLGVISVMQEVEERGEMIELAKLFD